MAGVVHCWERTQLLRAWERTVQVEATSKAKEMLIPGSPKKDMAKRPSGAICA